MNEEQLEVQAPVEKESRVMTPPQVEFEQFRYGDAVITCKSCGKDTIIKHPMFNNVEVAVQLPPLTTDNRQFLGLACEHCDAALTLRMIPSVTPPAHAFNQEGFGTKTKAMLTWTAGDDAVSYGIYIAELPEEEDSKDIELKLIGSTTDPSFELELKEDTSYRYRVDTVYGQDVYTSEVMSLSTKEEPVKETPKEDKE